MKIKKYWRIKIPEYFGVVKFSSHVLQYRLSLHWKHVPKYSKLYNVSKRSLFCNMLPKTARKWEGANFFDVKYCYNSVSTVRCILGLEDVQNLRPIERFTHKLCHSPYINAVYKNNSQNQFRIVRPTMRWDFDPL